MAWYAGDRWQLTNRGETEMYLEIDLDRNAMFTIGYAIVVALVVKMIIAMSKKN